MSEQRTNNGKLPKVVGRLQESQGEEKRTCERLPRA
nr:MAG TPA: hypothetical protein [Caudoviricetes sp.]